MTMSDLPTVAHVAIPHSVTLPPGSEGDNWALFLSILALHTSLTEERWRGGHWINFHNKLLSALIGRRYRERINAMIDAGIVESNERYSTGKEGVPAFTKSYRLAREHRTGKSCLHTLTTRPTIRKAIKTFEIDPDNLGPAGVHYRKCFDRFALAPEAAEDPRLSVRWYQWIIARWMNGQEFAHRCEYRRYHSLMTQLPRRARKHVRTLDGESVSLVDVSACQPLLLGYLSVCHQRCPSSTTNLPSYDAQIFDWHRGKVARDIAAWIELCETRSIYRFLYDAIQTHDGPTTTTITLANGRQREIDLRTISERSFKRASLIPVFDTLESMIRSPVFTVIRRDFPTIAAFIVSAKQAGHQRLACLLQCAESTLMIDRLGDTLSKRYPNVAVAPIHDALVVPHSFAETAVELINEQFQALGLMPHVRIESCSPVVNLSTQAPAMRT
ncbi:hypothetical protein RSSM_03802 [Rhodopirellula sallentina SM41]|uniref:Uncharacterized protein n=1 Tax=Rhodopirellula sallentina SM41 TaxID=1263870 RepID=M5UA12_9BACT|nr:hypothetical protein RSSM_03802 [Rhodopirellula sallentina SM41]